MKRRLTIAMGVLCALVIMAIPGEAIAKDSILRISGDVVGFQPGRSIILRLDDGRLANFLLTPTSKLGMDIQVGTRVTLGLRESRDGGLRVIDMLINLTRPVRKGIADASTVMPEGRVFSDEAMIDASRGAVPVTPAAGVVAPPAGTSVADLTPAGVIPDGSPRAGVVPATTITGIRAEDLVGTRVVSMTVPQLNAQEVRAAPEPASAMLGGVRSTRGVLPGTASGTSSASLGR